MFAPKIRKTRKDKGIPRKPKWYFFCIYKMPLTTFTPEQIEKFNNMESDKDKQKYGL